MAFSALVLCLHSKADHVLVVLAGRVQASCYMIQHSLLCCAVHSLHGRLLVLHCRLAGCWVHQTVKLEHSFTPVLNDSAFLLSCAGLLHVSNITHSCCRICSVGSSCSFSSPQHAPTRCAFLGYASNSTCRIPAAPTHECRLDFHFTQLWPQAINTSDVISHRNSLSCLQPNWGLG